MNNDNFKFNYYNYMKDTLRILVHKFRKYLLTISFLPKIYFLITEFKKKKY